MRSTTILLIFLVIGGFLIASSLQTSFSEQKGRETFVKEFGKWLWKVGGNVKNLMGFATKQKWLPEVQVNKTNMTL